MKLISEKQPLAVFKEASELLNKAVAHTLGPSGANTAVVYGGVAQNDAKFQIINDGKTIIDNLTSDVAETALAMQTIRESVLSTNSVAGDGTTSTIILINALLKALDTDDLVEYSNFEICRRLKNIKGQLLETVPGVTEQLSEDIPLSLIAETSLGSPEYVDLFIKAFDFVGENGKVLLEKSDSYTPYMEEIDGISFNMFGFIPELVLNEKGMINTTLGPCDTVIETEEIETLNFISDLLNKSKTNDRPILLFYHKMSADVFRIMANNLLKPGSGYKLIPISMEQCGNELVRYKKLLEIVTNKHESTDPIMKTMTKLNAIEGIIFTKDGVIIKPQSSLICTVASYISENSFNLSTKTAIIKAGAGNSILKEEIFRRFEDAIYSCTNALKYGVCTGGGTTYSLLAEVLRGKGQLGDFELPIVTAMDSIYCQLLKNCDLAVEDSLYLPKLQEDGSYKLDESYVIYDSITTVEQVIINAFDMVVSIFSTNTLICDPER